MIKFLLLTLMMLPLFVPAKSLVYVSDQVEIPLRQEESNRSQIIKMVLSGAQLELLKSTESGWTQVRTAEGEIGWIISRYLMNKPAARVELPELQSKYSIKNIELNQLQVRFGKLEKQFVDIQNNHQKTLIEKAKADTKIKHVEEIYQDSLKIEHENQQLNSKILQQSSEIKLLKQNSTYEQDRRARNWFIIGGLVLLLGAVLGAVLAFFFNKKPTHKY